MKPVSRQVSRQLRKLSWFRRQSASAGLFKKGYSTPNDFNAETSRAIDEIQSCVNDVRNSDIESVVEAIDTLSNRICLTADLADCVRSIHPVSEIADSADRCHQTLGAHVEELNSSADLHEPLKKFCDSPLISEVAEDTYRCATLLLHDFEKSGINLPERERLKYVEIHSSIIEKQSILAQSAREPSIYPSSAVSPQMLAALKSAQQAAEHKVQGVPHVFQYYWLGNHPIQEVRKASYLSFYNRPDLHSNNQDLFDDRRKMAQALGFESYADRSLLLAAPEKGAAEVRHILESVSAGLRPFVERDLEQLKLQLDSKDVGPWDVNCLDQSKFAAKYDLTNYLNIYDCFDGFSRIVDTLFGVRLEQTQPEHGETWHKDVIKFNVSHKDHGDYGNVDQIH